MTLESLHVMPSYSPASNLSIEDIAFTQTTSLYTYASALSRHCPILQSIISTMSPIHLCEIPPPSLQLHHSHQPFGADPAASPRPAYPLLSSLTHGYDTVLGCPPTHRRMTCGPPDLPRLVMLSEGARPV